MVGRSLGVSSKLLSIYALPKRGEGNVISKVLFIPRKMNNLKNIFQKMIAYIT